MSNSFTGFAGSHLCLPGFITDIKINAFSDSSLTTIFIDKTVVLESTTYRSPFYHCDENDGIGTDWWDCLDAVRDCMDRFDPKWPDDFIENAEYSVEEYCQTLSDKEFEEFETLLEEEQYKLAMRWRIKMYNEAKAMEAK